jgi:hypothetical protein
VRSPESRDFPNWDNSQGFVTLIMSAYGFFPGTTENTSTFWITCGVTGRPFS